MMCLARLHGQQQTSSDPESHKIIQEYRERIGQCLVLGKYTKCPPYTVETLLLLLQIEYIQETQMKIWVLFGTVVNLVLSAGYHRDPSHFLEISPFKAEMRRRTWASLVQFDALLSTQFGLPSMIQDSLCDSRMPLNLLDEDLDEHMVASPRPRPDNFHTPMQFLFAKTKIAKISLKISKLTESIESLPYAEIMRLDKFLNNIYSSIPEGLKMLGTAQMLNDTPENTMQRCQISIQYQRSKCVLHQKFMIDDSTDGQYALSRSACIEAALQILGYQQTLKRMREYNGQAYGRHWKSSSLEKSSFYLAAALLCLLLENDLTSDDRASQTKGRAIQALNTSHQIWLQENNPSREAQKVMNAVGIILGRAQDTRLIGSVGKNTALDVPLSKGSVTGKLPSRHTWGVFLLFPGLS
jgi:Fungal specific transcription factor domain